MFTKEHNNKAEKKKRKNKFEFMNIETTNLHLKKINIFGFIKKKILHTLNEIFKI